MSSAATMRCKRCGCTDEAPCTPRCAWMLPDLCTACLTPEEQAIDRQFASMVEGLRDELRQDRFERYLLAVAQGLAANPTINWTELFVGRAFELAVGLSEAADPEDEDPGDSDDPARSLVTR